MADYFYGLQSILYDCMDLSVVEYLTLTTAIANEENQ